MESNSAGQVIFLVVVPYFTDKEKLRRYFAEE